MCDRWLPLSGCNSSLFRLRFAARMFYFAHERGRNPANIPGVFRSRATRRTILIVDDDDELREALVEQLALHEEFDAVAVETGAKGVQAAKAGQIDIVIMDVGLPDIDGREAVRI